MKPVLVATIICPHCRTEVAAALEECPSCRRSMRVVDPLASPGRIIDQPWLILVLILHVGLLGIPVYLKTNYSLSTRLMICLASVAYTLVAVAIIVGVGSWLYQVFMG